MTQLPLRYLTPASQRVDARSWAADPPPWVLAHFVCSAWPGSDGREQALRAWGYWRPNAIRRHLPEYGRQWDAQRQRMLGIADRAHVQTMRDASVLAQLVLGLASHMGRTPVLPALDCNSAFSLVRQRCVWIARDQHWQRPGQHPNSSASCLIRWPNGCGDAMLLPSEAEEAAKGSTVTVPVSSSELTNVSKLVAQTQPLRTTRLLLLDIDELASFRLLRSKSARASVLLPLSPNSWPGASSGSSTAERPPHQHRACYNALNAAKCQAVC